MQSEVNCNEDIVIKIDGLSVRYRMTDEKISGIKEYIGKAITHKLHHKEFVALNNINLTIKRGERVGIIGHNGSGKSTLLKVIAHVIKPSSGTLEVYGSIAPLLELGAGFDLELNGIQNIYLNGSILGKSKKYLDMVKEDIVDFAELGEFINYPVKNYSSGMRAKLGFAIATQVESDILIVDEVFGVGDENFKRKSKAKMIQMINSGKTVIIVSHDMTQMVDLTDRVIWMNDGEIVGDGDPQIICNKYCEYMLEHQNVIVKSRAPRMVKKDEIKPIKEKVNSGAKSIISGFAEGTGLLNKLLNDSALLEELIVDRRVLKKIQKNQIIMDRVLESEYALDSIIGNDDILYRIFQNDVVREKLQESVFFNLGHDERTNKSMGKIDSCIYYRKRGLLYVKGWHIPVDAYTDVLLYIDGKLLGKAQRHLKRSRVGSKTESQVNKYCGWEFVKTISNYNDKFDKIEIIVKHADYVLTKDEALIEMTSDQIPDDIEWKVKHKYSEEVCWSIYQKYVLTGFNLISFQRKSLYNRLLREYEDVGCLYEKNYKSVENEWGFRLEINELGLRGPADLKAGNVLIGGGCGLCFGVDQDKTWFADEVFENNWLNLCYFCPPHQLSRLLANTVNNNKKVKNLIVMYEASFWSMGISKEIHINPEEESLWADTALTLEREAFYDFYNKLYEGVFRVYEGAYRILVNCKYAWFDFEKNMNKCEEVCREWNNILKPFKNVIVLKVPNKEYICAESAYDPVMEKLKRNQDFGWNLLKEKLSINKSIKFIEMDGFTTSDFHFATSYLNEQGNVKLRNWIVKSVG